MISRIPYLNQVIAADTAKEMMQMNKLMILISSLVLITITACTTNSENNEQGFNNLARDDFKELLDSNKKVFLLDTHIPEQQHIKGTDAFIPYNEIESNLDKLPEDKSIPIAVYCRSGSMSLAASQKLIDLGYENVYNLLGGANSWRAAGYEFEV